MDFLGIKHASKSVSQKPAQTAIKAKTYVALVDKLYTHTLLGVIGGFTITNILFYVLKGTNVNLLILNSWYYILLFFYFVCTLLYFAYRINKPNYKQIRKWSIAYSIMLVLFGIVWGSAGILLIPNDLVIQSFLLFFLFTNAATFAQGTTGNMGAGVLTVCAVLIPIGIWSVTQENYIICIMGYVAIMFTAFLLSSAFINTKTLKEAISLRYELDEANIALSKMNETLELKVKERTKDLEKALNEVTYLATHDSLTRLSNHRTLLENIHLYIQNSYSNKTSFGIVCFSIKDLGIIIDCYGYSIANKIIFDVADRLKSKIEELASITGHNYCLAISRRDDFFILIEPLSETDINEKVNRLFSILKEPIIIKEKNFKLDAYIGLCFYPEHGINADELLANAEAAVSSAKQLVYSHNRVSLYKKELGEKFRYRMQLEDNLKDALIHGEFFLEYQPIVNAIENKVSGMEALVRWAHPRLGLLSPNLFIELAEQNGLIIPLGEWILRQACTDTKLLHDAGFTDLKVSVNLSAIQLKSPTILKTILQILQDTQLNPRQLDLELTETTAFAIDSDILTIFKELKKIGISLSIDDFGTGHSNLDQIKKFAIDKIKIDGSFIRDLTTNVDNKVIIDHCVNLGKNLKIAVLAECVETKEQLEFLKNHGCPLIQGYYFSKPLLLNTFTEFLNIHKNGIKYDKLIPINL